MNDLLNITGKIIKFDGDNGVVVKFKDCQYYFPYQALRLSKDHEDGQRKVRKTSVEKKWFLLD